MYFNMKENAIHAAFDLSSKQLESLYIAVP